METYSFLMLSEVVHLPRLLESGGPVVVLQLALAILGGLFVIERMFYFARARINIGDFLIGISALTQKRAFEEAQYEASRTPGPAARVSYAILRRHRMSRSDLRDIAQEAGQLEVPRIEKNIRIILAVALVSPLLGMLGTVLGLIEVFRVLGEGGQASALELGQGVFQALGSTAIGLLVAIPAYIFYLYFLGRAKRLIHRIERAGIEIVNLVCDAHSETEELVLQSMAEESEPKQKEKDRAAK